MQTNILTPPPGMSLIPAGPFRMGSNEMSWTQPVRMVSVPDFFISKHDVTVEEFRDFISDMRARKSTWVGMVADRATLEMKALHWAQSSEDVLRLGKINNPSGFQYILGPAHTVFGRRPEIAPNNLLSLLHGGLLVFELIDPDLPKNASHPKQPITGMDWFTALAFCNAKGGRLPYEAEFEKAAKGSQLHPFGTATGELWQNGKKLAHFDEKELAEVGSYLPNESDLFDMSGNVWKWCMDWFLPNYDPIDTHDPKGPPFGQLKVVRGGAYNFPDWSCKTSDRSFYPPTMPRKGIVGIRLVKRPKNVTSEKSLRLFIPSEN